jgi:hypothetical protein
VLCPLCATLASEAEGNLLSHLLANHPVALLVLGACLAAGNLALARRPRELFALDGAVLGAALYISRA